MGAIYLEYHSKNYFRVCVWSICTFVCICACVCLYIHVEGRDWLQVSSVVAFHLIFAQGLSLNLQLTRWLQGLPGSTLTQCWDCQHALHHLGAYVGAREFKSCSYKWCTEWTLYSAPMTINCYRLTRMNCLSVFIQFYFIKVNKPYYLKNFFNLSSECILAIINNFHHHIPGYHYS